LLLEVSLGFPSRHLVLLYLLNETSNLAANSVYVATQEHTLALKRLISYIGETYLLD